MSTCILVVAYNRPELLKRLYTSLFNQVRILEDCTLLTQIDYGSPKFDTVLKLARSSDVVAYPKRHLGINHNTFEGMRFAYEEIKAEWVIYLEEDLLLSPDALAFLGWCQGASRTLPRVGAYCLCNRVKDRPDPRLVRYGARRFTGWGFMMHRAVWQQTARKCWLDGKSMWDNRLANHLRAAGFFNVFPYLSRVTNTGRVGAHLTPSKFNKMMRGHKYQRERKVFNYVLV